MAPAKKKPRVQVVENELSAAESHGKKGSQCVPPVSILKDSITNLPRVKPQPNTDEMDPLNLRRKTYFINGADKLDENEPSVIHNTQEQLSLSTDEKIRRLTYVVSSFLHEDSACPLVKDNTEMEIPHSELEIKKAQMQESVNVDQKTVKDIKPNKRGRKKTNAAPALTLHKDSDSTGNTENAGGKKEPADVEQIVLQDVKPNKRGGKKKNTATSMYKDSEPMCGTENVSADIEKTALQDFKPNKRGRKKDNDVSASTFYKAIESMDGTENDHDINSQTAVGTKSKSGRKKRSTTSIKEVPVKTMASEKEVESDSRQEVTSEDGNKKAEKTQEEENKTVLTQSAPLKKSVRGRKKKVT